MVYQMSEIKRVKKILDITIKMFHIYLFFSVNFDEQIEKYIFVDLQKYCFFIDAMSISISGQCLCLFYIILRCTLFDVYEFTFIITDNYNNTGHKSDAINYKIICTCLPPVMSCCECKSLGGNVRVPFNSRGVVRMRIYLLFL